MSTILIKYKPFPYQLELHSNKSRFKIVAGGRRVGKSLSNLHHLVAHCLCTPHANAWWVSPTLGDAREVGWEEFKNHLPELSGAIKTLNETRMKAVFTNGAVLTFKGGENERSLRGRGLSALVIDEAAYIDENIWKKALRPALTDKQGWAVLCSTPNGKNWFWESYVNAKKSRIWDFYHWPTELNPIISESDLADAKRELSNIDFRQEYMAEFITKAGLVYDDFNESNVIDSFTLNYDHHNIYLGMDFGYASYTAVCFIAEDRRTGEVVQFDEMFVTRTDIDRIITNIKKMPFADRIKAIYTDPAGNAEELTSGISPVDTLRQAGFTVLNKGTSIAPGLTLVRSYICSADGNRRFFVHKKCVHTLKSIEAYSYTTVKSSGLIKEEPEKDGYSDHMCDAIRYFFVNRFDKAKWVTDNVEQVDYLRSLDTYKNKTIMKRCTNCRGLFTSKTPKNKPPYVCNACKETITNA